MKNNPYNNVIMNTVIYCEGYTTLQKFTSTSVEREALKVLFQMIWVSVIAHH